MPSRPLDTSPEAWEIYLAAMRALDPGERVRIALELSEDVRSLQIAGLRDRYPWMTEAEAVRHLVEREFGVVLPAGP